jgi:hypothetical protein
MDTTPIPPDLSEFLRLLSDHQVEYLLIGGYAVSYHGYPRSTLDMDIWIATSERNAKKVVAALDAFGFGGGSLSPHLFDRPDQITRLGYPPFLIEILTKFPGSSSARLILIESLMKSTASRCLLSLTKT